MTGVPNAISISLKSHRQSIKTCGNITQRVESLSQLLPDGIGVHTMSKNEKEPKAVFPVYSMVTPYSPTLKFPEEAPLETSQW